MGIKKRNVYCKINPPSNQRHYLKMYNITGMLIEDVLRHYSPSNLFKDSVGVCRLLTKHSLNILKKMLPSITWISFIGGNQLELSMVNQPNIEIHEKTRRILFSSEYNNFITRCNILVISDAIQNENNIMRLCTDLKKLKHVNAIVFTLGSSKDYSDIDELTQATLDLLKCCKLLKNVN